LNLQINSKALKDLRSFDRKKSIRILEEITSLKNYPNVSNITKLTNFKPSYRKRVGNYRVLFEIDDNEIIVYRILHRKESYKSQLQNYLGM